MWSHSCANLSSVSRRAKRNRVIAKNNDPRINSRSYARAAALSAGLLRNRIRDQSLDEPCPWRGGGPRPEAMERIARHALEIGLQDRFGCAATKPSRHGFHSQRRADRRSQIHSEQFPTQRARRGTAP